MEKKGEGGIAHDGKTSLPGSKGNDVWVEGGINEQASMIKGRRKGREKVDRRRMILTQVAGSGGRIARNGK